MWGQVPSKPRVRDHPNSSFCVPVKKPCMWQQKENQEKLPLEFYMCRNIFQKTLIFYNTIEGNIRVYWKKSEIIWFFLGHRAWNKHRLSKTTGKVWNWYHLGKASQHGRAQKQQTWLRHTEGPWRCCNGLFCWKGGRREGWRRRGRMEPGVRPFPVSSTSPQNFQRRWLHASHSQES